MKREQDDIHFHSQLPSNVVLTTLLVFWQKSLVLQKYKGSVDEDMLFQAQVWNVIQEARF